MKSKAVGPTLKNRRIELNISASSLSGRIGVSKNTWIAYETGTNALNRNNPKHREYVDAACRILDLNPGSVWNTEVDKDVKPRTDLADSLIDALVEADQKEVRVLIAKSLKTALTSYLAPI